MGDSRTGNLRPQRFRVEEHSYPGARDAATSYRGLQRHQPLVLGGPQHHSGTRDLRSGRRRQHASLYSARHEVPFLIMVKGKLAVVTGGANGIGWAAARLLAANGASVCIFDREKAG